MDKRKHIGKILLLTGAIFILLRVAWSTWQYLFPQALYFIKNVHVLSDKTLPVEYNRIYFSGLASLMASLFRYSFLLLMSIITLKWFRHEKHSVSLISCAYMLFGFGVVEIISGGLGTTSFVLSCIGNILIVIGSLLIVSRQEHSEIGMVRFGIAITDISSVMMLLFSGNFIGTAISSIDVSFQPEVFSITQEIYSENAAVWMSLMLCFLTLAGLGMFLMGRRHFLFYSGSFRHGQLRFALTTLVFQLVSALIWFGTYFFAAEPSIRFILLFTSSFYLIGTLLLFISWRRRKQNKSKLILE
jgi:hypothetical protein